MKFLLSIILWAIVPMLTPQGLQIGVVNINNKTIRIMKMNLNNPAFLQSAGNVLHVYETRLTFAEEQNQLLLSANGLVTIESVQDGVKVRSTYEALNRTTIPINADPNTEVFIYGAVTEIANVSEDGRPLTLAIKEIDASKNTALTTLVCVNCEGLTSLDVSKNTALTTLYCYQCTGLTSLDVSKSTALTTLDCTNCIGLTSLDVSKNTALTTLDCHQCTGLTSLDVSKNTALTTLGCGDCIGLTSLDVSKNTALTTLYCANCEGLTLLDVSKNTALTTLYCNDCIGLTLLDIQNTALLDGSILYDMSPNLTTLQVAGTSAWAYEQVESWLNGDAPSDGTILVDENTPQEVITAATAKNWTVEYVDAA